jgi:hypothetical protein
MKRYTEEQLRNSMNSMKTYIKMYDESVIDKIVDNHIKSLGGVELPSDEEIDRESELLYPINEGGSMWMPSRSDIDKYNRQEGFLACAKWMRDKIGGNK